MLLDHLTDAAPLTTMAPANSFYTSSPTVVLPPAGMNPHIAAGHYAEQPINLNGFSTSSAFPSVASVPKGSASLAGRKRSRSISEDPDDDQDGLEDGSVRTPPTEEHEHPFGKQILESGMNIDHSPGTSAESAIMGGERIEGESAEASLVQRPSATSRKSQRMGSTAAGGDDLAQLVLPPQMREATTEPLIDEATRVLGISWTRMDSSEALQISQAAYARWIQNHYPGLKEVAVWFENSAIPGYLVAALNAYTGQHEYYIFSNDLTEARLVTSEPSQLMPRLKMLPALHLAAPGGCIRAETDAIINVQSEVSGAQMPTACGVAASSNPLNSATQTEPVDVGADSVKPSHSESMCTAHEMELD